ncbi:hypothetical protein VTN96DRAFT_4794 [Rasamsonia emersonii]
MMAEPDIFTFTEIHMPTSVVDMSMNFVDGSSEYGRKLVASLRQLREALGSSYIDKLAKFTTSPGYETYLSGLSITQRPVTYAANFVINAWYFPLERYTAMAKVYFPDPVSDEQREKVDDMDGRSIRSGGDPETNT